MQTNEANNANDVDEQTAATIGRQLIEAIAAGVSLEHDGMEIFTRHGWSKDQLAGAVAPVLDDAIRSAAAKAEAGESNMEQPDVVDNQADLSLAARDGYLLLPASGVEGGIVRYGDTGRCLKVDIDMDPTERAQLVHRILEEDRAQA